MEKLEFSPVIVGTMRLGEWGAKMTTKELEAFVDECVDMGLTDFDHADIYGHYTTETEFGKLLQSRPDLRNKIQITSKAGVRLTTPRRPEHTLNYYDNSKTHLLTSCEHSLKELQTDHIDLYLVHRPDYLMNPYEMAEALTQLKKEGKIRHYGVSNFTASQFDMLNALIPLATNQIEVSILHLEAFDNGTLDQHQKHNITPTAWSPLGGGRIFQDEDDEQVKRLQPLLKKLSEKYNAPVDQILLAWLGKHPSGIISVIGTSKIERVRSALAATQLDISREDWYKLWTTSTGEGMK